MKRILRLSTLAGVFVVAISLAHLAPREASAGPLFRFYNGNSYYNGGYSSSYRSYSGYGYRPYGNGGYSYVAPRGYVYPADRSYDYGYGAGNSRMYRGYINNPYRGSGFYVQPYRSPYNPYGNGGYGPYGFSGDIEFGF
ncbi:MAG: hypothetical protein ACKV0T_14055 [Planctomycetales bacterium]